MIVVAAVAACTAVAAGGRNAGTPSNSTSNSASVSPAEVGPVQLDMAVQPGSPVPMRIVTEKSSGELAGKGFTGQGIDVALIDSGVAPVVGLDQPGKIVYGPDLSNEGSLANLANLDTYGHGTHLAGIIAGNDGDQVGGVAPSSRIVSIKVAGATGETSIAQVIAGIDWVVEHKNDGGLNIRVLNLSLGVGGIASSIGDPLSAAVERAWKAGIVVVAAAGNRGNAAGGIDSPALSPYVIAVGAHESYDSSGAQDWIAPWSSGGNAVRQPDFVAPGRSIMSFRVPGSMLDQMYPQAVVNGKYFLGSGSSQSAAVVSGFSAALLSRDPSLTPDQLKFVFQSRSIDFKEVASTVDGNGKLSPKDTARNLKDKLKAPVQTYQPALLTSGTSGVAAPTGSTWSGGTWNGSTWSGGTWSGASWSGSTWSGASWSGGIWSGASWSGASWSGASWSGASWSGAGWSGASWSGSTWSGSTWSGFSWANASFSGSSWT
jgi:serine protease AprX